MKFKKSFAAVAIATVAGASLLAGTSAQADTNVTVRDSSLIPSLSATRANGSVTVGSNGIGFVTQGTGSTSKAAEYWAADIPLADAGTPTMTILNAIGSLPGAQLYVNVDGAANTSMAGNDGYKGADGILVGESSVYGPDWWLAASGTQAMKDGAPLHTGGSGSDNHGTLAAWSDAFPNARIVAVGFSLGSGAQGAGVLSKMSVGDTNYTFTGKDAVVPPTPEPNAAPSNLTATSTFNAVLLKWDAVPNAKSYQVLDSTGTYVLGVATGTVATIQDRRPNTSYTYKVAAQKSDGFSGPKSSAVTIKTDPATLLAPSGLKCTPLTTSSVHCTANSQTGANRYGWYADTGVNGTIVAHGSSDAPTYDIVGLPRGSHKVRVAADNETQGPGPASALITVSTK